ncbi:hypothetical protein [Ruania alba]|uniref:Uncharacterized protein n=1 Tax=Ruania alba TaxID=648782 RepID=A0A1H5MSP3_9MICO|nr:hypothetical protein [Ruania alba]SEE92200.1 hypothetical protein SAMN04488554_3603 [Ruania alba]
MTITAVITAIAPPLVLAILFTVAIRAIIHADRRERQAQARAEQKAEGSGEDRAES